jgi:D-aminopeptidase
MHRAIPRRSAHMKARLICLVLLLVGFVTITKAQNRPPLKIYISADMEGVVGVVTNEQLGPQGFEYARFREFMTNEVNAAIEGAIAAGATGIVVSDSHGNGQNLLIEKLPTNYLSIVERTDAHSIRFTGKDMVEVSKFLEFIVTYEPGLEP